MADNSNMQNDIWRSVFGVQRQYMDGLAQLSTSVAEMARSGLSNMVHMNRLGMDVTRAGMSSMIEASRFGEGQGSRSRALMVPPRGGAPGRQSDSETVQDQVIDVGEEVLDVNKKRVAGATTRVRRVINHVPVEQAIQLFDETVVVERVPVTTEEASGDALVEREYLMQDMREVPVVQKRTQLRERVRLHRERTPRVETIREVLTKTDVEVEQPRQMSVVAS